MAVAVLMVVSSPGAVSALDATWTNNLNSHASNIASNTEVVTLTYPVLGPATPNTDASDTVCAPSTQVYQIAAGRCDSMSNRHRGEDIYTAAQEAFQIVAALGGTVDQAGCAPGAGYRVNIIGSDGRYYRYFHMDNSLAVSRGQTVATGQLLGTVGNYDGCQSTGTAPAPAFRPLRQSFVHVVTVLHTGPVPLAAKRLREARLGGRWLDGRGLHLLGVDCRDGAVRWQSHAWDALRRMAEQRRLQQQPEREPVHRLVRIEWLSPAVSDGHRPRRALPLGPDAAAGVRRRRSLHQCRLLSGLCSQGARGGFLRFANSDVYTGTDGIQRQSFTGGCIANLGAYGAYAQPWGDTVCPA